MQRLLIINQVMEINFIQPIVNQQPPTSFESKCYS